MAARLLGFGARIPVVSVVCCQVEVFATGRLLIQKSIIMCVRACVRVCVNQCDQVQQCPSTATIIRQRAVRVR